jgi:hypothetical protein
VTTPARVLSLANNNVRDGIAKSGVPIKIMFKNYLFVEARSKIEQFFLGHEDFMW